MDISKIKFSVIQICFWCSSAAFASYMGAYMQSKGMSATLLGVMFTVNTLSAFCGQFFFGMLCDRFRTHKKIFAFSIVLIVVIQFILFFSNSWYLAIVTFGLFGFIQQPMIANMDTWILKTYKETPQVYGPIRSMGSFTFAVFNFFYGGLLDKNGYGIMIIFSTAFLAVGLITVIFTPDIREVSKEKSSPLSKEKLVSLFSSKEYVAVLLLLFGTGVASAPMIQMLVVVMSNVGGSVEHIGYCMFISALLQVPLMFFAAKMHHIPPKIRIAAAALLYTLSLVTAGLSNSWWMVVLASAINGAGFGLYLPALREYITKISPPELNTTAQSVSDAVSNCLGGMISGLMVGLLFDRLSIPFTIWICSGIQLVFLFIFVLSIKKSKT